MGILAQSCPSDNEYPPRGLAPTVPPPSPPPLHDNHGYATDDTYKEYDERRQSSGLLSTKTFSVTNETQLRRMSSESVDTMVSPNEINMAYVNSDDDYTEPKSVYSEGNGNNDVVTEAIVHRDAMPASAAVGVQSDGNAAEAKTPVIGAAAATPKTSSVSTMSSDKIAKSSNGNAMKRKSSPD